MTLYYNTTYIIYLTAYINISSLIFILLDITALLYFNEIAYFTEIKQSLFQFISIIITNF